jgi:enoyl-[acyl-carrier protein] reductase II
MGQSVAFDSSAKSTFEGNRVVAHTGSEYPIFQAPIGFMARSQWVGAVSAGGGMGLMETSFQTPEDLERETELVRSRTNRPFGYHLIPESLLSKRDHVEAVVDWLVQKRAPFVTMGYPSGTSDTHPDKWRFIAPLKDAGAVCYYVVDSIDGALRAEDAGVDGLILGGGEAGGVRDANGLHIFSLIQGVRRRSNLPLVASGGISDGIGMAGAFALGAEGVLMGTRFMASDDGVLHQGFKEALAAAEQIYYLDYGQPGTVMLGVKNEYSDRIMSGEIKPNGFPYFGDAKACMWGGRTDVAVVGGGESAILFDTIKPAAEIIEDTVTGFWAEIDRLANLRSKAMQTVG